MAPKYFIRRDRIKGPLKLKSGWRRISLSGLLTVKGTLMREQGSLKGEGTHRGNLCVDAQIFPNPDSPVGGAVHIHKEKQQKLLLMPADILPTFTNLQRVTFYLLFTLFVSQIYKVSLKEMKVYMKEI